MKVSEISGFRPVTITLETPREVTVFQEALANGIERTQTLMMQGCNLPKGSEVLDLASKINKGIGLL